MKQRGGWAWALGVAVVGCGGSGPGTPVDAGFDAGPPPPSRIFGPCVIDEQCPGAGAYCLDAIDDGVPGGVCTAPCVDRSPCDDGMVYHHCNPQPDGTNRCEQRCLNGLDCERTGFTCVGDFGGGTGACVGICSSDAECGPGAACNLYSGLCHAEGVAAVGSRTGETCVLDADCLSDSCIPERNGANPSGWNGGACIGPCILPRGYNTNSFFAGETLPSGACADGAICFPGVESNTEGDMGVCVQACVTSADCRAADGFECVSAFDLQSGLVATFSNGVCLPISCDTTTCPAGLTCRRLTTTRGTRFVCERL